jgi:3-hydroxybutyryl-CoA dehydrogenase
MMNIKKIGVIGAGQMGNGITQVAAQSGFEVVMSDIAQEFLDKGMASITKNLNRSVAKERITQATMDEILGRISTSIDYKAFADADLVIEAAPESIDLKKKIFTELDNITPDHAILATNTSSISITLIASVTKRPDKVIGMHFMNPVPVMKLIEVIRGIDTSDEVNTTIFELSEAMGKTPVEVNDYPGFVANRILLPMLNEAMYAVFEGVATPEAVDSVMKLGMNHPMGPLALADLIGLDTCLHIMEVLYEGFSDSKYRPCPLLKKMVAAGYLGRKTGRGFYTY